MKNSIRKNHSNLYFARRFLIAIFLPLLGAISLNSNCIAQTAQQERALNEFAKKIDEGRALEELGKLEGRRKISNEEWENTGNLVIIFVVIGIFGWILLRLSDSQHAKTLIRKENEERLSSIVEQLTNTESRNISKIGQSEIARMDLKTIANSIRVPLLRAAKGLEILEWDCLDYLGSKTIDFKKRAKKQAKEEASFSSASEDVIYNKLVYEYRVDFLKNKELQIPLENRNIVIRFKTDVDYTGAKLYFGFFDEKYNSIENCEGWYTDFEEEEFSTKKSVEIFHDTVDYFDPFYDFNLGDNTNMFYLNKINIPKNCKYITLSFYPKNSFNETIESLEVGFWPSGLSGACIINNWKFNDDVNSFFQVGLIDINKTEVNFLKNSILVKNATPKKLGKSIKVISKKFSWIE